MNVHRYEPVLDRPDTWLATVQNLVLSERDLHLSSATAILSHDCVPLRVQDRVYGDPMLSTS